MNTTPPPMPEPVNLAAGGKGTWGMKTYGPLFNQQQLEARDAQWMERIAALEAEFKIIDEMNDQLREQNTSLDAACAKLEAENKRLNDSLRWEQNRAERIGTHGPGCEKWGPAHYECLLRHAEKLETEIAALKPDAERYRWWRYNACYRPSEVAKLLAPLFTPPSIDAAIDAARAAMEKTK